MTTTETTTPARRRFRLRRRHLIVLLVVLAALCGGIFGITQWVTSSKSKPAVAAANLFLQNIVHDDFADAYAQLCATTKKIYTEQEFEEYVKSQPAIVDHQPDSVRLYTVNGVNSAVVGMNLTLNGGAVQPRNLVLDEEGGKWMICGDANHPY